MVMDMTMVIVEVSNERRLIIQFCCASQLREVSLATWGRETTMYEM